VHMAARALWKAVLQTGSTPVPVRLYSAVEDRKTHFHLLHAEDRVRVHERMRSVEDDRVVEHAEALSGYALESGEIVMLSKKDLASLAPKPSRDIALVQCVSRDALPMAAFGRPYWLGPDGKEDAYYALAQALGAAERFGIVEWIMRNKHHFGALSEREGRLMLVELRSADQWVDSKQLKAPEGKPENTREVAMAEQLINGLEGAFEHDSFHDSYREQVQKLVEAKARGGKLPKQRAPRRAAPTSLSDALNASLRALKKPANQSQHKERKSA
jgi:DNA end-binding protein Ku